MTVTIEQINQPTPELRRLIGELDAVLNAAYEPHQRHGLAIAQLFEPHVRFFVARLDGAAVACGGIALFDGYAEVKRMYTRPRARGRGVAIALPVEFLEASAEEIPLDADSMDAVVTTWTLCTIPDASRALAEMRRVTRPGGTIAACVWDHAGGRGPLAAFWSAVRELDPAADDESGLAGVREGHLASLFSQAGLDRAQAATLTVTSRHTSFDDWWQPFTLGVGPADNTG